MADIGFSPQTSHGGASGKVFRPLLELMRYRAASCRLCWLFSSPSLLPAHQRGRFLSSSLKQIKKQLVYVESHETLQLI